MYHIFRGAPSDLGCKIGFSNEKTEAILKFYFFKGEYLNQFRENNFSIIGKTL